MNGVACSGFWLNIFCSLLSQLLSVCCPAYVSCTPSNLYPLIRHSTALLVFSYLKPSSIYPSISTTRCITKARKIKPELPLL
uniref:Putative secreted protein n=1 Tax=Rhipicephalus microplus TaxID=6941 RepID=A0A6M2DDG8_RHIMP